MTLLALVVIVAVLAVPTVKAFRRAADKLAAISEELNVNRQIALMELQFQEVSDD